jgi:hypothetical protein
MTYFQIIQSLLQPKGVQKYVTFDFWPKKVEYVRKFVEIRVDDRRTMYDRTKEPEYTPNFQPEQKYIPHTAYLRIPRTPTRE